jgi:uncharacterized membrane protein YuzA (DUF378 family)
MKTWNLITLIILIIGGLNMGIYGLTNFNIFSAIFAGSQSGLDRVIEVIVGLCALWQLVPFGKAFSVGELHAEANV